MLGLASSLTLGWLALRHTEWSTLKAQLGGSSVEALLLAVALFLLASLVVQHLSIEGCRRLGRGGFETRPVVVGRRSNHW